MGVVVSEMDSLQVSKTVMARLVVVAMAVAVAVAQEGSGVGLPAGHEDILTNPYDPESFSCEGQDYGYYADVASGCEIFHICLPIRGVAQPLWLRRVWGGAGGLLRHSLWQRLKM